MPCAMIERLLEGERLPTAGFIVTVSGDVVEPDGGLLRMGTLIEIRARRHERDARLVPWLLRGRGAPAAREPFEISPFGSHWEALDEDVSVEGFSPGAGAGGE